MMSQQVIICMTLPYITRICP